MSTRKRSLRSSNKKEADPKSKKVKMAAGTKKGDGKGSKPSLRKLWTHTNPDTGEVETRMYRKDANYKAHANRRTKKRKEKKKKKSPKRKTADESKEIDVDADLEYSDLTKRFQGQVCVVVGGGDNVGQTIALRLAKEGASVFILDRYKWVDTITLCEEHTINKGAVFKGIRVDISDTKAVKAAVKEVAEEFGYIDVLVNADMLHRGEGLDTADLSQRDVNKVLSTNYIGVFNVCQAVIPFMKTEKYGRICNVVSHSGRQAQRGELLEGSASAAVIAMTQSLARELAWEKTGVLVNAVSVAFIEGENSDQKEAAESVPLQRLGMTGEVAGLVAFAVSEEQSFATGAVFDCTGGLGSY